jgi:hypothetical protein
LLAGCREARYLEVGVIDARARGRCATGKQEKQGYERGLHGTGQSCGLKWAPFITGIAGIDEQRCRLVAMFGVPVNAFALPQDAPALNGILGEL